jgi:large subunit ribosomal protein L4
MSAQVLTIDSAKAANLTVVEDGRGTQAVHDAIVAMRAARRQGSACAKTRGEVAGSNKKPWRQKGTGRARAGERRSPVWVGGGVVFGPRPRDYTKDINKKTKKLAFRKALSERIKASDVAMLSTFAIADGKTKSFIKAISALTDATKVLIISSAFDQKTFQAGRNHAKVLLMTAAEVNTENLLYYDKIFITSDALETLVQRTAA